MIQYRRDLYKVITEPGNAAEIGVAEGHFSAEMLRWPNLFPKVYMVDRWAQAIRQRGDAAHPQNWHDANLQAACVRVQPYGDRAIFLRGDSAVMAEFVPVLSLTFCNIDGDHSYEGVMADLNAWFPKLKLGGVMAFHDFENVAYGVKKAVTEFARREALELQLLPEDKPEDAGAYFIVL